MLADHFQILQRIVVVDVFSRLFLLARHRLDRLLTTLVNTDFLDFEVRFPGVTHGVSSTVFALIDKLVYLPYYFDTPCSLFVILCVILVSFGSILLSILRVNQRSLLRVCVLQFCIVEDTDILNAAFGIAWFLQVCPVLLISQFLALLDIIVVIEYAVIDVFCQVVLFGVANFCVRLGTIVDQDVVRSKARLLVLLAAVPFWVLAVVVVYLVYSILIIIVVDLVDCILVVARGQIIDQLIFLDGVSRLADHYFPIGHQA